MSDGKHPLPDGVNVEIEALIATLHETGKRLEELTAGEVDSVADREGRTFVLRRAQEELRYSEAAKQVAILNTLPAYIALIDTQGIVVSVNEAWRRFTTTNVTMGPGHRIGLNYLAICDGACGDDSPHARQAAAGIRAVLGGAATTYSFEYPCHSPKEQRWFLMTAVPLGQDHPAGAVVVHADISERKQAEREAAESKQRLDGIIRSAMDAIVTANDEGRIVLANPAAESMFGYSASELEGKRLDLLIPERFRAGHSAHVAAFGNATDSSRRVGALRPISGVRKNGEEFPLEASISKDESTGRRIFTAILRDITERHRAAAELEKTHEQLLEASRQGGMAEVATNVLHNVGNVLNSVNVSASLVEENIRNSRAVSMTRVAGLLREHKEDLGHYITSDPKGRHIPAFLEQLAVDWMGQQEAAVRELGLLRTNIDHIKAIVAMHQAYAKVSGATETVNVKDLVEDSLRMDESSNLALDLRVIRKYEHVPPISLEKHKVLQILVNLLRNARHACDALGEGKKRVTVAVTQADGCVRISVSDNGVGIAPENLTRIFAHGFTTRKDGHGFGLHSGALAAKEMGGSLSLHSEGLGRGATFTLVLPMQVRVPSP